jgi:hypothetical protein
MLKDHELFVNRAEQHPFTPHPKDDYRCAQCGKPRALHARDGFVPQRTPSRLAMGQAVRYQSIGERTSRKTHDS